ncbi:LacI family DNA-binding transcriptional regulator [Paenibacillus thermotolerans]|uniref:LacI family DNA-binding transcriptional regulator n=1 Tax=Paenibacillus thermotolerans TaxID=3027807 RepID=UPI0023676B56|nr:MULTISPECIES: LacI family DNA-binding transcriptional regulator [unclassified Paenibacillus]
MTTLKQIAEHVGVSISTVSRAISNDMSRPVNAETQRKIREAATRLGYEWNESQKKQKRSASKPASKSSKRIGCIAKQSLLDNHPFFSSLLSGFRKKLADMGSSAEFVRTLEEVDDETKMRDYLRETGVQGILAIGWYDKALFELLNESGIVLLGVSMNDETVTIPIVDCDRVSAARTAVRHLIAQGHRKIGFIGGTDFSRMTMESEERFLGYKFAMLQAGLEINRDWVLNANWNVDRSYSVMADMLERLKSDEERPTAMFCASDMLAIPAMRAAHEKQCLIPGHIAFAGMDDIEVAQYTSPPLTSIQVPKYEIGETAAKTLIELLEGQYALPPKILLPYKLIVRESSEFTRTPQ